MPITFKSPAYANVTMLDEVGMRMLEMMAYGVAVPGAITASEAPVALANLNRALAQIPVLVAADDGHDDDQPKVSLQTRALPLVELLQAASDDETYLRWEQG